MMKRRDFLKLSSTSAAAAAVGPLAGLARAAQADRRPNFVWILSEDNSKHYMKLFDPTGAPTPAIEKLASRGLVFTRAFSNAPVCSVARTTVMTGMLAPRVGTQYHRKLKPAHLPAGVRMWPAYLRQAGYYTTNNRKKDYNCVEGKGVWDESSGKASWRKRPSKDTPFFHMESTAVSHESRLHFGPKKMPPTKTDPKKVTLADYHPDTPLFRYTYARYHDCMGAIDQHVAGTVAKLEKDGLLEDTFVFYFGDHGGVLAGSKGYIREAGVHVPLVVRVPENFKHLAPLPAGSRSGGFVSFIDFGPTLLHLAGLAAVKQLDGRAFLGAGITAEKLNARDETFSYADRFDEKYETCRALRKGRFKYQRNYQCFYPDGLQNNYRYRMQAYRQWRDMYKAGKLRAAQRAFFEAKPAETLYDVEADPHEVHNLAGDPKYAKTLADLRRRLQQQVKAMCDLSMYPESHMIDHALADPAAFGQKHKDEIALLVDTADLALLPFTEAKGKLAAAIDSKNDWVRYWALTACSCFGKQAASLAPAARARLKDKNLLVRVRAAEFLAIACREDPRPTLYDVLATTTSPAEALITLNSVVYVRDHLDGFPIDARQIKMKIKHSQCSRRMEYLRKA